MGSTNEVIQILNDFGNEISFDIFNNTSIQKSKIDLLIETYEKYNNHLREEEQIDLCTQIGRYYACQGEEQQAFDYFLRGMQIAKKLGDFLRQAILYSYISTSYLRINSYHEALKNYHMERNCYNSIARETDYIAERILLLNINLGICYCYLKCYDRADMYLKIIDGKRFARIRDKYQVWVNTLRAKVNLGLGEFEQAYYYINLIIMDSKDKRNRDYFWAYRDVFYMLLENGRKEDAKVIMIALIEIAEDSDLDYIEMESADAVVSYCRLFGDRSSYISAMKEFMNKSMKEEHILKEQKQLGVLLRSEISKLQMENKRLIRKIDHYKEKERLDEVTQLPNQLSLNGYAKETFEKAKISHAGFGIDLVSVKNLEQVRDIYGHMIGEKCICRIADVLRHACDGTYIARNQENQFVLLFASSTKNCIEEVCSNLQQSLNELVMEQGGELPMKELSFNQSLVYLTPKADQSLLEVFQLAEQALIQ